MPEKSDFQKLIESTPARELAAMASGSVFAGSIAIEDFERTTKYVKFRGTYQCVLCGASGVQVTAYWRDKFPDGVTDEQVSEDMKMCVEKNHVHAKKFLGGRA